MTKLVYIGGYGHSGSTLLEYLLTARPGVVACGEVVSSIRRGTKTRSTLKNKECTCGQMAEDCPVWSVAYSAADRSPGWTHDRLVHALLQQLNGRYAGMVDSSKTAWGGLSSPFRFRRDMGSDFHLIHLVRDPRAVFWSVLKQKRRRARRHGYTPLHHGLLGIWTALAWSVANLSCELLGLIHPHAYVRVRYEDLAQSPAAVLQSLYAKLLPNVQWNLDEIGTSNNRHQLHGNAMRFRQLSVAEVREDLSWKTEMPEDYLRFVMPISYLLRRRYGYR